MEDLTLRKDLNEVIAAVKMIDGSLGYLSQRVAWSEICFRQVQDSGVMDMAAMTKQIMLDHKKLQSQFSMLNMRITALLNEGGNGSQGGTTSAVGSTIDEQIWALAVQLNECEVGSSEAMGIIAQLNYLQVKREQQPNTFRPKRR